MGVPGVAACVPLSGRKRRAEGRARSPWDPGDPPSPPVGAIQADLCLLDCPQPAGSRPHRITAELLAFGPGLRKLPGFPSCQAISMPAESRFPASHEARPRHRDGRIANRKGTVQRSSESSQPTPWGVWGAAEGRRSCPESRSVRHFLPEPISPRASAPCPTGRRQGGCIVIPARITTDSIGGQAGPLLVYCEQLEMSIWRVHCIRPAPWDSGKPTACLWI
jgi:hypothetical protein